MAPRFSKSNAAPAPFARRDASETVHASDYETVGATNATHDAAENIGKDERGYDYDYGQANLLTKVPFTGTGGAVKVAH